MDPYCSLLSIQCTEWFKEQNLLFALAVSILLKGQVLHVLELHFFSSCRLCMLEFGLYKEVAKVSWAYAMKGLSGNTSLQRFED